MTSLRTRPFDLAFVGAAPLTVRSSLQGCAVSRRPTSAAPARRTPARVQASLPFNTPELATAAAAFSPDQATSAAFLRLAEVSEVNYNSLAVTAFVFFLVFWGSISFVKGSIKTRETQASFSLPVPARDVAGTVTSYLVNRGFTADLKKDPRPGVITFEGTVRASSSVAVILVLVAGSGLWATSLILNVLLPEALQSPYWGWISLLSFAMVPWYKGQAERVEEVKVMVEEADDADRLASESFPVGVDGTAPETTQSILFMKAHRDEIGTLEEALGWVRNDPDGEEGLRVMAQAMANAEKTDKAGVPAQAAE